MRQGSGVPYIPRLAYRPLKGLGQDDDDLFDDSGNLDDASGGGDVAGSVLDESNGDLLDTVSAPSSTDLSTSLDTYDPITGQDITPSGVPVTASGATGLASIVSGIASLFGGGALTNQINGTGISEGESDTTDLTWLLLIGVAVGAIYLAARD
jgi:hypothetical protein